MVILRIDFEQIKVIPAEKENEEHKKSIWNVFNENLGYNLITSEPVPYEKHSIWWERVFENEYIYVILYKSKVCGYIRLTKYRTELKEKDEISIALKNEFQKMGIGSYAFNLFENKIKEIGITQIVAITDFRNKLGQKFFEKNDFKKFHIRYVKKL